LRFKLQAFPHRLNLALQFRILFLQSMKLLTIFPEVPTASEDGECECQNEGSSF